MIENYLEVSFLTFGENDRQEAITVMASVKHPLHLGMIEHNRRCEIINGDFLQHVLRGAITAMVRKQRLVLWENLKGHPYLNMAVRPFNKNHLPWTAVTLTTQLIENNHLDHFFANAIRRG